MTATAFAGARVILRNLVRRPGSQLVTSCNLRSSMRTGYLGPWIDREVVRQVSGRPLCRPTGESQFRVGRVGERPLKACIARTSTPVRARERTCADFVRDIP
jgi:hypothetical protein